MDGRENYIMLAQQALARHNYAHPAVAQSLLKAVSPITGRMYVNVPLAVGHGKDAINATVEELVKRGVAERTDDPLVIKLKSNGGK